jgi:predicted DNA repair protein MutK
MSGGLLALLDDVVALTKLTAAALDDAVGQAAQAGSKAAGVVIDDAAVTPRYVVGLAAERELPIVAKIAWGSLKNKIIFLLPAALGLSAVAPWALTPILMLGGLYLAFEGYEKVHEMLASHESSGPSPDAMATVDPVALEDQKVTGAIRTDLVLSAEIMAISLASITEPDLFTKAVVLAAVALMVTAGVYGAVALIVKADDFGVYLAQRGGAVSAWFGRALVHGMPPFLKALSMIGTVAMLWVGGGILVHGLNEFGISAPEHLLHSASETVSSFLPAIGGALGWLTTALSSAIIGLAAGWLTALIWGIVGAPVFALFKKGA